MKGNKCILVFEDDLAILSILNYIFEEKGWKLVSSTDCYDLLEKVRHHQPYIIMMDNNIDPFGGVIATRRIKSEADLQDIPIIFFSASNNVEALAVKAGADTFLAKPFNLDRLEAIIEKMTSRPAAENK